ncbi:MAG: amidohydrolase family protein, partial [Acidobacteriota bacterium]|nr:amidohydrolase family protein [Acidobacteriota bacterium]
MKKRILLLLVLSLLPATIAWSRQSSIQSSSILIYGGVVIDGTGTKRRLADVRIVGNQIKDIGRLKPQSGERVIDAKGLIVAPGFIDVHNHSEQGLLREPDAKSQVLQGITTLAIGPDGGSPVPIADYLTRLEKQQAAVNIISFIGHATVRRRVMGEDTKRAATAGEIVKMAELVEQGMR